ncbi:MAG: putative zinc-binding metallopeptidase [Planctomycetota bacterium]
MRPGRKSTAARVSRNGSPGGFGEGEPDWAVLSDEELLEVRLCDLGLQIEGTPLERRMERLYEELRMRQIGFRPHCWLSDEWFSPDGVPGIGIPFYLAHPRLIRLERKQVLEVEGGTKDWSMRILRHEAGHALDTAYRLHRRRKWREVFGKYSEPYPEYYDPRPYSKSYVQHLDQWYAQCHPAEDFAETFAVWVKPRSGWRMHYRGWPALKKLEYVDQVMAGIRAKKPQVVSRRRAAALRTVRKTRRDHYEEKRARYGIGHPSLPDRELRRLFSDAQEHARRPSAAVFLRRIGPELRRAVAQWTGEYQYTINQVLEEMIERCRQLDLRLDRRQEQAKRDTLVMLTVQTMNYLHGGHHRVAL